MLNDSFHVFPFKYPIACNENTAYMCIYVCVRLCVFVYITNVLSCLLSLLAVQNICKSVCKCSIHSSHMHVTFNDVFVFLRLCSCLIRLPPASGTLWVSLFKVIFSLLGNHSDLTLSPHALYFQRGYVLGVKPGFLLWCHFHSHHDSYVLSQLVL